jgi:hypothetical protein
MMDGTHKRRWIGFAGHGNRRQLRGRVISSARLWKEFVRAPIETRTIERLADGCGAAAYGTPRPDAVLAPGTAPSSRWPTHPGGRSRALTIRLRRPPRRRAGAVLGFAALQLSPDRDRTRRTRTRSGGQADLRVTARGWLAACRRRCRERAHRCPNPTARRLGHLHGNCGHCHNAPVR